MKKPIARVHVVLLAAGRGSRLGGDGPKCLTRLAPRGPSIMGRQLEGLARLQPASVTAVVGYQQEKVRAAHPGLRFVVNARYAETNTAKSLLQALESLPGGDVLWLNGDVVFDPPVLDDLLACPCSAMLVNRARCGEEEIKYRTDGSDRILEVSKQVCNGQGEAVGINLVRAADRAALVECLRACADRDYFERGLELAIDGGLRLLAVDVGSWRCMEIDFPEDLARAREWMKDSVLNSQ